MFLDGFRLGLSALAPRTPRDHYLVEIKRQTEGADESSLKRKIEPYSVDAELLELVEELIDFCASSPAVAL